MGFLPNSLSVMGKKPNILGSFSMLYTNIKGFSSSQTSLWTGIKILFKNLRWTLKAKKESHLEVPTYLKDLIAHVSSNAAGCKYWQAHTAHTAHKNGVQIEKIQKIWEFRKETSVPLCFTLDAGANVHLLYPNQNIEVIHSFIKEELSPYCQNRQYLFDAVGTGAKKV